MASDFSSAQSHKVKRPSTANEAAEEQFRQLYPMYRPARYSRTLLKPMLCSRENFTVQRIRELNSGAEDIVGIAMWGVHAAINLRETLSPTGQPPKVWYPDIQTELPRLLVTLHTDGLMHTKDEDTQARDWLVATSQNNLVFDVPYP